MLSNKAKKAIEADYFKALHKRMMLEAKRGELEKQINAQTDQMDGIAALLGYKPTKELPEATEASND